MLPRCPAAHTCCIVLFPADTPTPEGIPKKMFCWFFCSDENEMDVEGMRDP